MATCCNAMSKLAIVAINLLTWVVAAGFIFLSIWLFREFGIYGMVMDKNACTLLPAAILLTVGLVLFLVGLVGCVGAVKEHKCIIGLYFSLLLVVFIGIGVGAGLSYMLRRTIDDQMHELLMDEFKRYSDNSTAKTVIDEMQSNMQCCGVDNYTDWLTLPWYETHQNYPASCCKNNSCDSSDVNTTTVMPFYAQGCYTKIKDTFSGHIVALYYIIGATALILLIGMASACMLLRDRRNRDFVYRDLGSDDGLHV